jgi:signal transduction histidine kinase
MKAMKTDSIAFRLVAGAALWLGVALIVSGFVLAGLFVDHVERGFDRRISILLESLVAVSEISPEGELIITDPPGEPRFGQPYSGWYWQVGAGGLVVRRSPSLWDDVLALSPGPAARAGLHEVDGPQGRRLRVVERAITLPGSTETYRFVVAADSAELEAEIRPFTFTLAWSLGALWAGLIAAAIIQVRFGLQPMRRIRAALSEVRAGREDRLQGEFPAEVLPLVDELNAHLGQIDDVVARARTHVGNLAHALKTPLSVLGNEAARSEGTLAETVKRQTETMARRVDHYLVRARTAASAGRIGARTEVAPILDDLGRTLERIHASRGVTISIDFPDGLVFRGDRQDLEEIVGNVLDNACKWAAGEIRVHARRREMSFTLVVEDDGPGLPAEDRNRAFARGDRLDEAVPGSGLGLSIVREISELYGGGAELGVSELGGLKVEISLPAAEN